MAGISSCENKARLLEEYHQANDLYLKSVELLRSVDNTSNDYEKLKLFVERASTASVEATKNLDLHTYQHGC